MDHHPLSGCRWIAAAKECQSPIFLRRFTAENPLSATLHITGLGYFYAEINGNAVSDHYFQPVVSEYGPRDLSIFLYPIMDRFFHRIYFCSYDVSTLLRSGKNCLSIQLGNGWYRQTERSVEGPMAYGDTLKTIFCLELVYPDRILRICSDGSETWQESNILDSCLDPLLKSLLGKGWDVRVRPHPEYMKRYKPRMDAIVERWQGNGDLTFELDFTSNRSIFDSDLLITDWSGTAYEFSFVTLKSAVFIQKS